MWSRQASLDLRGIAFLRSRNSPAKNQANTGTAGCGASILGVGHFTVPPDVIEGPDRLPSASVTESWSTIRTIVVPHGISAVPRRSPITARKRTPWNPLPEVHGVVERGGSREWFTDRLFVESKQANLRAACSTSAMVHVVLVILVLLLLAARAARADLMPRTLMAVTLRMPDLTSLLPDAVAPPTARKSVERSAPADPAPPAPPAARAIETPAPAPLEAPSSVEPETPTLDGAPSEGALGVEISGATDGAPGGVPGGTGSGASVEPAQQAADTGPFRVGDGIDRPRKIRDVKPVYPLPALRAQIGGNILIEATIGADGKVHDARVVKSIALLDQAALDAVRQWEFEPSRRNGVPVAVTMVIIVSFALL
jgi:periplasmic protein TonB